jgi:hypothetical protein
MTEEEFVKVARAKWAELEKIKDAKSLYEFEGKFDEIVQDLNRQMLEGVLGDVPKDRRKKKES